AMPHQIIDQENVESFLAVTVPLAWILQWRLPGVLMKPLLQGKVLASGEPRCAAEDVMMLSRWVDSMGDAPKTRQPIGLLELQARLLRFASSEPSVLPRAAARRGRGSAKELSKAERLAGFVAEHCTERLTAVDMGQAVGLHPNYAMGLFKSTFGMTLN